MTSALRILDRFEESANGRRFSGLWLADFGLDGMTMFGSAKDVSFFGIIQFCFFFFYEQNAKMLINFERL